MDALLGPEPPADLPPVAAAAAAPPAPQQAAAVAAHVAASAAAGGPAAPAGGEAARFPAAVPRGARVQQLQQQELPAERRLSTAVSIGPTISAAPDAAMPGTAAGSGGGLVAVPECPDTASAPAAAGGAAGSAGAAPATVAPPSTIHADTWRSLVDLGVASPPTGGSGRQLWAGSRQAVTPCRFVPSTRSGLSPAHRLPASCPPGQLQVTPPLWAPLCTWAPSQAAPWPRPPCCSLGPCSRASTAAAAAACAPAAACGGALGLGVCSPLNRVPLQQLQSQIVVCCGEARWWRRIPTPHHHAPFFSPTPSTNVQRRHAAAPRAVHPAACGSRAERAARSAR